MLGEPEEDLFIRRVWEASTVRLSAVSYWETSVVVLSRRGASGLAAFEDFAANARMRIEPVTESTARIAIDAWLRFGKGRHPASLNFGDCFSYALAKSMGEPLLFKGRDFGQTDIESAL